MKYIDYMEQHPKENMSWCRPFLSDDGHALALNEGDPTCRFPDGAIGGQELMKRFAMEVNPSYDLYSGWDDIHIALECMHEVGCVDCPFADMCEVMNDELEG